jgi:hypothetical protein
MTAVAHQRCLHHPEREAVARCPECGQFFCRECITEHDERVICAACLKKLAQAEARPARSSWDVWPAVQIVGGLAVAWAVFYYAGETLLDLPAEFHDDQLWQARLTHTLQGRTSDDE